MYNIEFIEENGEYELREGEKFAKVRILTREHGHKSIKVPIENIKEILNSTEHALIEIPSGRRVYKDIEEDKEYILIPPIKGG